MPLIAYTASVLNEEKSRLNESDLFQEVLEKPINLEEFDDLLEKYNIK